MRNFKFLFKLLTISSLTFLLCEMAFAKMDQNDFLKALATIKKESVVSISDDEIYSEALKGVLRGINKKLYPHSVLKEDFNTLISNQSFAEMKKEMEGEITGIGIVIKSSDKDSFYPYIEKVLPNSSAKKAGLLEKDLILAIDGKSSRDLPFTDLVYKIRGKENSQINLTLLRNNKVIEKKVTREKIAFSTIEEKNVAKDFTYIIIRGFNEKSASELKKIVAKNKTRKIIFDLRDSMGSPLDAMIKSLDLFVDKDKIMFQIEKKGKGEREKIIAKEGHITKNVKFIVVINKNTMCASETFATTLQKLSKATIIGETSFGKGTVETIMALPNNYHMKLSTGKMIDSAGQSWIETGIKPDFEIKFEEGTDEDNFNKIIKMASIL